MVATSEALQLLWAATLAVGIAMLALMVLPRFLRRHFGAGVAYAVWWLVPAAFIASLLPAPVVVDSGTAVPAAASLQTLVEPVLVPIATAPAALPVDHGAWWLWLWLAGVALMAVRLSIQQRRFVRGLGAMRPLRDDLWKAQARHGLPALLGVLRARIVLPEDFEQRFEPRERQLMLAHERRHRSRGDHLANFAFAVARCLFWFNPLVHLAATRFRHDQELACDQAVITAHPDSRRAYGEAMLKTLMADRQAPLGCHWGFSHPLKERIMQLKTPAPRPWTRRLGVAIVAMLTMGAGFTVWSAQPARPQAMPGLASLPVAATPSAADGIYFYIQTESSGSTSVIPQMVQWVGAGQKVPIEFQMGHPGTMPVMQVVLAAARGAGGVMQADVAIAKLPPGKTAAGRRVPGSERVRIDVPSDRYVTVDRPVAGTDYRVLVRARRGANPCGSGQVTGGLYDPSNGMPLKFTCEMEGLSDARPATRLDSAVARGTPPMRVAQLGDRGLPVPLPPPAAPESPPAPPAPPASLKRGTAPPPPASPPPAPSESSAPTAPTAQSPVVSPVPAAPALPAIPAALARVIEDDTVSNGEKMAAIRQHIRQRRDDMRALAAQADAAAPADAPMPPTAPEADR